MRRSVSSGSPAGTGPAAGPAPVRPSGWAHSQVCSNSTVSTLTSAGARTTRATGSTVEAVSGTRASERSATISLVGTCSTTRTCC